MVRVWIALFIHALEQKHPEQIKKLKVVQILGPFTNSPIVVRSDIPEKQFRLLQEAFITMHQDPYGKAILEKTILKSF